MGYLHSYFVWANGFHVPDVVWAALIAASVAFVTTTLSNRNSRKQLAMQLQHSANQQKLEREMAVRRDVYLPAIEAIARIQGALGRLASVKEDYQEISRGIAVDLATVTKAHLVAKQETVTALMQYTTGTMPAFVKLMNLRTPLVSRHEKIEATKRNMDAALAEQAQTVQLMKQFNISGNPDRAAFDRLTKQAENEMKVFRQLQVEIHGLKIDQALEISKLATTLSEVLLQSSSLLPDILLSARRDLDLPLDEAEYRRLTTEQQQAGRQSIEDAQAMVRGELQKVAAAIDALPNSTGE